MINIFDLFGLIAVIGLIFVLLTLHGWALNGKQCLIALDQWLATCLISGAYADETISAMAHRRQWKRTERVINFIFCDENHCGKAYLAEKNRTQQPKEYQ